MPSETALRWPGGAAKGFVREHTDTRLISSTPCKKSGGRGREVQYATNYEVITKLKRFADISGVCLLVVHHTRKQQADDKFDMISGTNGLLGAADGAFLLQKERRADNAATLDISGRDQQDQRLYLKRDEERLVWELERRETELRQEPPDPVLEAVAALVTAERPEWRGTATELVAALGLDMKPNALAMRLNVRAWRLSYEYHIRYESARTHAGGSIGHVEPPRRDDRDGRDDFAAPPPVSKSVTVVTAVTGSGGESQGGIPAGGDCRKQYNPNPLTFPTENTCRVGERPLAFPPCPRRVKSLGGVQGALFKGRPCWGSRPQTAGAKPPHHPVGRKCAFDGRQAVKSAFALLSQKVTKARRLRGGKGRRD